MKINGSVDADPPPTRRSASPSWRRSTRCESGDCAEVRIGYKVGFRNSTQVDHVLEFSRAEWADFTAALRRGEFDRRP